MARKKSSATAGKVKFQGFVNVYLNPQEKKQIKANLLDSEQILDFIQLAADEGYKFSLSFSDSGGFYSATLYGNEVSCGNPGYAMTIRHADVQTAVSGLAFVVGQDGWKSDWAERFTTAGDNDW